MTPADISAALKEETYMDGQGGFATYRELIPLLKVLRYRALHSDIVFETLEEVPVSPDIKVVRISSMYWIR
jgi:hypothetical protein